MPRTRKGLTEVKKDFSIQKAIGFGWNISKTQAKVWGPIAFIYLMMIILNGIFRWTLKHSELESVHKTLILLIYVFAYWPLRIWFDAGLMWVAIRAATGKKVRVENIFVSWNRALKYTAGSMMLGIVVIIGLFLLIIPGIILGIKYMFVPYLMLDKLLPMGDAFDLSEKMSKGLGMNLFRFKLNCIGVLLIGFLVFFVGMTWAVMVIQIATAFVYRNLLLKNDRRLALRVVS